MARRFLSPVGLFLAVLALANLSLLTAAGEPARVAGAMILLLVPGPVWAETVLRDANRLLRWLLGLGLSFVLVGCLALLLHYLPGPVPTWAEVLALDGLALVLLLARVRQNGASSAVGLPNSEAAPSRITAALLLVLIVAAAVLFRFASLGYSEFQGDESLAMISAAESLEGHEDALFLRGKGPGEVLLPMALWRLTGTIDEGSARLPFAVAGALIPLSGFLLAVDLFRTRGSGLAAGLAAAALLALNGFMVAFSRIVQYQSLVVLMSGLALLSAWQWRRDGRARWLVLCGLFLGAGLLAHYDALLVVPALAYAVGSALFQARRPPPCEAPKSIGAGRGLARAIVAGPGEGPSAPASPSHGRAAISLLAAGLALLVVAGLFYVPYLLDPQAARTGGYLGDRIGGQALKNNLESFQRLNVFYTSFAYYALTGLLVLGFLTWACRRIYGLRRLPGAFYWVPSGLALAVLALAVWPTALRTPSVDLAFLPFTLILLGAACSASLDDGRRTAVLWLAVPFLGYNFGVAVPLTHIYTVVPAWTLLAGLALASVAQRLFAQQGAGWRQSRNLRWPAAALVLIAVALFGGYLALAYLRHDVEFQQDWPRGRSALYWTPYAELPLTGFFGFSHRTGWKAVGALYAEARLAGDYGSNEEPDVTAWYTRGAPRACDPEPQYYFIADGLVDASPVDMAAIRAGYDALAEVRLPNGKGLVVYQARPAESVVAAGGTPERLDLAALDLAFDRSAVPAAFARSARGSQAADINLGGLVRLVGYDVETQRARPGGRLAVTLYWQALAPLSEDYHVFVHLEQGQIWGQADGRPVCWTYSTQDWRPGQVIADHHAVAIRPDTPPGEYPLLVGMYTPGDGRRLDVLDAAGKPVANYVRLATVAIR